MRRTEREVNDETFMYQVLHDAGELYLACNTGQAPYVIAVNHVLIDRKLYFHCATEGRKHDLLALDNRVGFTAAVDIAVDGTTTRYRSVCGTGRAEIVHDAAERTVMLKALAARFKAPCFFPVSEQKLAATCIVRIDIDSLTGKHSHRGEGKRPMPHYER